MDAAGALLAAPAGDAAASGAASGAAAAGPPSVMLGDEVGAMSAPFMAWQQLLGATVAPAVMASRTQYRLAFEAGALALVYKATAVATSVAATPAMVADALEVVRSSRLACTAMPLLSALGLPEPQAHAGMCLGLRCAVEMLSRLARASASPRAVEAVLAMCLRGAELAARVDACAGAVLGPDAGAPPAPRASRKQVALQRELLSASMCASVHGAPLEARLVLYAALAAALEHVRAVPVAAWTDHQGCGAPAVSPCEAAAVKAAAARELAVWAYQTIDAAVNAPPAGHGQLSEASAAFQTARQAGEEAVAATEAALAPGRAAGTASGDGESDGSEGAPDDESEEVDLAVPEPFYAMPEAFHGGGHDTLSIGKIALFGRDECACTPGSNTVL